MTPEFSRPERLDTIGERPRDVAVSATADECAALARRFGLVSVERLDATFAVHREGSAVIARGRVTAAVVQACSITDEPLPATVDEPVDLRFADEAEGDGGGGEEVELDADALDVLPIEGGAVDLGEAAAETLALALDPFPRGPNAAAALKEAGVISEEQAGPFGALAALREKLAGQS